MVFVKLPNRTGTAWKLWPKPTYIERRHVPSSETIQAGMMMMIMISRPYLKLHLT